MNQTISKMPVKNEIANLMALCDTFSALLVHETKALRQSDFEGVDALQKQKKEMADKYNDTVNKLYQRKEEFASLDMATRENFVLARTQFTKILHENMRALENTKESAKRLSNRILETIRQTVTQENQTSYSAKGRVQSYKSSSLSLNIDQKL